MADRAFGWSAIFAWLVLLSLPYRYGFAAVKVALVAWIVLSRLAHAYRMTHAYRTMQHTC